MPHDPHIWIQPGKRLHMIVQRSSCYEIWTATSSRVDDSSTWHGSYIELYPNGDVIAVERNEAGAEDRFYIKRGDK